MLSVYTMVLRRGLRLVPAVIRPLAQTGQQIKLIEQGLVLARVHLIRQLVQVGQRIACLTIIIVSRLRCRSDGRRTRLTAGQR